MQLNKRVRKEAKKYELTDTEIANAIKYGEKRPANNHITHSIYVDVHVIHREWDIKSVWRKIPTLK